MMGAVSDVHPPDPDLARDIDGCCRLTGEFTLRSGQVSHEYFDKYLFEAEPALLRDIAEAMASLVPAGTRGAMAVTSSRRSPGSASNRYLSKYSLLVTPDRSRNVPVMWATS